MNKTIENKLKGLPSESGCYIMKSSDGTVIYVGKAKSLKSRVSQYFKSNLKERKTEALVSHIADFDYIITPSETEALALENNLIKKYMPFYNILLKDSKTFPYIKINLKETFPRFEVTRIVKNDKAKYFGPYIGVSAAKIVKILNETLGLRDCGITLFKSAKRVRECLNYSLSLCSAPCTNQISKEDYDKQIDKAIEFLKGNTKEFESLLTQKMNAAAENTNFEGALVFRDRLTAVQKLCETTIANLPRNISRDAVYYLTDGISATVSVVILRGGRIMGVNNFSVQNVAMSEEDAMFSFVSQYYIGKAIPDDIIINHPIQNTAMLEEYFEKKLSFITSPIGVNLRLLNMAKRNAEEYMRVSQTKEEQKYKRTIGALERLKENLSLKKLPMRIECYDISHISGTNKVASMVVFVGGEPKRKHYRKFNIKTVEGNNDFESLKEALSRRLARLLKKDGESFDERPDLLVIDGGKGQLSSVVSILGENNDIEIISLAKRIEEVFKPNSTSAIMLKPDSAELKLLQHIRDEAHRFAITAHRQKRTKTMLK